MAPEVIRHERYDSAAEPVEFTRDAPRARERVETPAERLAREMSRTQIAIGVADGLGARRRARGLGAGVGRGGGVGRSSRRKGPRFERVVDSLDAMLPEVRLGKPSPERVAFAGATQGLAGMFQGMFGGEVRVKTHSKKERAKWGT